MDAGLSSRVTYHDAVAMLTGDIFEFDVLSRWSSDFAVSVATEDMGD